MKMELLFMFMALFACCHGHTFKMGGCPKVKVMKDFEMEKFTGDWYVVGRYNPVSTCVKLFIDKTEDGKFTAEETSRPFGFNLGLYRNRRPRKLIIVKNETEAIFKVSHQFRPFGANTYGILETDYETYAVVWGCDPVLMGSIQNLDILSRSPKSEENYEILKQAKETAERKGIDTRALGKIEHANCVSMRKDGSNMIPSETEEADHGMEVE